MRKLKARPRIQRVFLAWQRQNAHRFAVPVQIKSRNDQTIELGFAGITPVISARLTKAGFIIEAWFENDLIDLMSDYEILLQLTPTGYICALCGEAGHTYPTRSSIWQEHLFEEFLNWVNDTLAPARWIRLSKIDAGGSWARLIHDESDLEKLLLIEKQKSRLSPQKHPINHWLIPIRTTT